MQTSGTTVSAWMASTHLESPPALAEDCAADVCVVGAGIAGLTSAYLLAQAGRKVVVLDDGPLCGGETCRTTAHLTDAIDDRFVSIERIHGQTGARLAAESHAAAIHRIEQIVTKEKIDCDFRRLDGYLFLPPGGEMEELEAELQAAHRAGLVQAELLRGMPAPSLAERACIRFPNQGQFHPLKYLQALADRIRGMGGQIHSGTHAEEVSDDPHPRVSTTLGPVVTAQSVIVAANTPFIDRVAIHTKQAPYRTFVIAMNVPSGSVVPALYWDCTWPYHYVRIQPGARFDLLIVGGEDHKTAQADDGPQRFARLEEWARATFPQAGVVLHRWSGQVMETMDGLGFIGRNPGCDNGIYIATGDSGMGMTHGTIAGMLLTDLIQERENAWTHLYEPSRKPIGAAGEFVRENLNVAAQLADWITPGEVAGADDVQPGCGAVIRKGLRKIAVYRDASGKLVERSAVCRHVGCVVTWNSTEKTWDCPCHGSRYDATGHVVNGPSNQDLAPAHEKEKARK